MGKITSLIEFNGSVGNLVGYKGRDGRNIVRHKIANPRNAQSILQMRRRVAWANLVNIWGAVTQYMHPSFNNKPDGMTDFNAFMSANVDVSPVFLAKSEARKGYCIVSPVMLTDGELDPISVAMVSGGKMRSGLSVGDLVIDSETTIGAFSRAIMQNNLGWENGDQLTGVAVYQMSADAQGTPRVSVIAQRVILDSASNDLLQDTLEADSGSADAMFSVTDGYLASKSTVNGGCCWIHSRRENGKTIVSAQSLVVNNNILSDFTTADAQKAAMKSYGVKATYLTPVGNEYAANSGNPMP